jgi:hypothetical protein
MSATKFHTHTTPQAKLYFYIPCYLNFWIATREIYVVKNKVQYIRGTMVALREAVISKYIRNITIDFVPSDSPTQTTPRTIARFPTLPNLDVCELYEQSSYKYCPGR